tara:strand:- start:4478 stop:5152 length:675 start_codon:yes stop_codon:yes gene_type:complete
MFILAKRLSEEERKFIVKYFTEGKTIVELTEEFNSSKLTIIRTLKKNLGDEKYKDIINQSKINYQPIDNDQEENAVENKNDLGKEKYIENPSNEYQDVGLLPINVFTEISPLNYEIENNDQKDLSSVPIADVDFPQIVYMIVDKKIELEIKYLKEYPEWQFLSQDDLKRKTIEIYIDLKIAKRFCNKEQKVIKVPNTNVFKIVAPILLNKGISRIVSADKLISL